MLFRSPSDATVLFDGSNLAQWQSDNGEDARWKIQDGYMEVNGTGSIRTRESFGSCQLHVEFATPTEIKEVLGTTEQRLFREPNSHLKYL